MTRTCADSRYFGRTVNTGAEQDLLIIDGMEGSRAARAMSASVWMDKPEAFEWKRLERLLSPPARGRWRLKALDAGAGENENDNDPTFLTARRLEYPPHTPHRS